MTHKLLSIEPGSKGLAWAVLADEERILETGDWTAGGSIERDLQDVLERVQPVQILIGLLAGGADQGADVRKVVDLIEVCEEWVQGIRKIGGLRPEVIVLAATREDTGGVVEMGLWWIRESRAGAVVLAGIGEQEGAR